MDIFARVPRTPRACPGEECSNILADSDSHALCESCRQCTEDDPCPICSGWSSVLWKRFRSRRTRLLKLKKRLSREKEISSRVNTSASAVSVTPMISASASAVSTNQTVPSSCTTAAVSSDTVTHSFPSHVPPYAVTTASSAAYMTGEPNAATLALSPSAIAACVAPIPSGFVAPVTLFSGVSGPAKTRSSKVPAAMVALTTSSVVSVTSASVISSPLGVRDSHSPNNMAVTREQEFISDNFPVSSTHSSSVGVTSWSRGSSRDSLNSEFASTRPGGLQTYPGWYYPPPPGLPNFPRGIGHSGGGFAHPQGGFAAPPPPPGHPAWTYPPWMPMPGYSPAPVGYSPPPGWESHRPGGPSTTIVRPPQDDSPSESLAKSYSDSGPMDSSIRSVGSEHDTPRSRSSSGMDLSTGAEDEVWVPPVGSLTTYRGAVDSVKAFLSSYLAARGEEFNLSPPTITDVSGAWGRLLPLTQEIEEPTPALPWTPFLREALRRSNLSARAIPRSQWLEFSGNVPLPPATQAGAGSGKLSGFKPAVAPSQAYQSFPLTRGEERLDYPIQPPLQPSRVEELSSSDPRMSVTWAQVTEWEGAIRRSLSMLSHTSWWVGSLVLASQEGAPPQPETDKVWAQAGLEATSAAMDLLQRVSTSMLLARRDAVLQTMELPFHRRLTLRTAPVESRDLFGPDFDRLMTQWSQRDQEDRVVTAPHLPQAPPRPRGGSIPPSRVSTTTQALGQRRKRQKNKSVSSSSSAPPRYPPHPGAGRGRGRGSRGRGGK